MDVSEVLITKAYEFVKKAHKVYLEGHKQAYFPVLVGMQPFAVSDNGGHNPDAVLMAIYKLHKEDNNAKYNDGFLDGLLSLIERLSTVQSLLIIYTYLNYQLEYEDRGMATFTVDKDLIINKLKEKMDSFKDNKEMYDCYINILVRLKEKYNV
jgi:hypothetical protein